MAQFKFNLQAVLRQRELVEQDRQRAFAEIQRRYAAMESELQKMDAAVRDATEQLRQNHLIGRINVEYLSAHRRFTLAMQRKAFQHAERMSAVRNELEAARASLVAAARDRKAMETLRDNRRTDWQNEQNQKEAVATDEVAQQIGRANTAAQAAADAATPEARRSNATFARLRADGGEL